MSDTNTEPLKGLAPEKWADYYFDYLFSFAMNRLKDRQLSEDMVQQTFLVGLSKINLFKGNSSELTWLTAILKNSIYDFLRKRSKQGKLEDVHFSEDNEDEHFEKNGAWKQTSKFRSWDHEKMDPLERKELFQVFEKCLAHLPPQWASVFAMKHLDDTDSANIRKELNISASNLWTIMRRAKLKLRCCIEKTWLDQ